VTQSKINAGSPSTGQLLQWSGSALQWGSPLVDNSTIDLTSGQLEVAALGITNGKIANTTITGGKLASGININTTGSVSANNLTASGNVTATALVSGESVKARKFYCTEAGGVNAFAGTGTILSGSNSSTISSNIISSNSIILLTVGSGAGQVAGIIAGLKVSFVNPGIDFTVKTLDNTNAPAAGIPFSYMIIN
ncbi:MAG TPA: hypothetical protein VMD02_06180, partial [Candidatus Omnitrophota bacterium]|nr:hypothetical protein [Candidatus Omnitrophota bacterium]